MAIAFVQALNEHNYQSTIDLAWPSTTAGHVAVLFCGGFEANGGPTFTVSGTYGFTEIAQEAELGGSDRTIGVWVRELTGSETGNINITTTGISGPGVCDLSIWSGVDSAILDVTYSTASHYGNDGNGNVLNLSGFPDITPVTTGAAIIACQYTANAGVDLTKTAGAPSGFTIGSGMSYIGSASSLNHRDIVVAYELSGSGTVGDFTNSGRTPTSGDNSGIVIALKPAASTVETTVSPSSEATVTVETEAPSLLRRIEAGPSSEATVTVEAEAPTVTTETVVPVTVSPSVATVTIETEAPGLATSTAFTRSPTDATIQVQTEAPSLLRKMAVQPGTATITVSTETPALDDEHVVAPDTATITVATDSPTLLRARHVAPTTADIQIVTEVPSLSLTGAAVAVDEDARSLLGSGGRHLDSDRRLANQQAVIIECIRLFLEEVA